MPIHPFKDGLQQGRIPKPGETRQDAFLILAQGKKDLAQGFGIAPKGDARGVSLHPPIQPDQPLAASGQFLSEARL